MHQFLFSAWTTVLASAIVPAAPQQHAAQPTSQPGAALAGTFPVSPGFRPITTFEVPAFSAATPLSNARTLVFDGEHVDIYDTAGALERRVSSTSTFLFPAFVLADEARGLAWFAESSQDGVFELDLVSGATTQLGTLHFVFAGALAGPDELLLSASPCGLSCGSDLARLDRSTHVLTTLGHVPGASGPVVVDSAGGLVYGFQADVFPQPGELWISRWSAAQLASGAPLRVEDATKVASGLDGDASIAIDPQSGHVFVAQSRFYGGSEILELDAQGRRVGVVATSSAYFSNLACTTVATSGVPGALQPYQPRGMRLAWLETDFALATPRTFLRTVEPVRPVLDVVVDPQGRCSLRVTHGPPGATAVVGVLPAAQAFVPEVQLATAPWWIFAAAPALGANSPRGRCDASGAALVPWRRVPHATSALQAFFFDAQGFLIASSGPVTH